MSLPTSPINYLFNFNIANIIVIAVVSATKLRSNKVKVKSFKW